MCKSAVILESVFGDSARWVMPSFLLVACGHACIWSAVFMHMS